MFGEDSKMRRLLLILKNTSEAPDIPGEMPNMPGIPSIPEQYIGTTTKLFYTSTTDAVITPYSTTAFGSTIASNAYDSNIDMFVIDFNGDVTTVGSNAFRNRSNLENVIMPNSVTSIGDRAFYYCSSLKSINTGENVTSIGASAFSTCNLTAISLGSNLTSIGQYAFYGCESLATIYCMATTPPNGAYGMMEGLAETCKIYVPMGTEDAYKSAKYWSNYSDMIYGYNF